MCAVRIEATGSGRQILQIDDGSTLRATTGMTIQPGGDVDLRGGRLAGGAITNASNSISGYGEISADVINQGLIAAHMGSSDILQFTGANFDNQANGTLLARAGTSIPIDAAITQSGTIEIRTLGLVTLDTALANSTGGLVDLLGGSLSAASVTNAASAEITGFGTIDGSIRNDGAMVVVADMQVVGDLINNGTITIQNGVLTVTGGVSGSGVIVGGF